ncbi:hypothetical protein [Saccharobesus litoralis]|uniref:hypothetical protein n=1 Tax=Saccharobesus litoralis TaxID=2172099 RepID=UPI00131EF955|nr:hypothetical protein [Saccharobesus litoralis]
MKSDKSHELDANISEQEMRDVLAQVNSIWQQAKIEYILSGFEAINAIGAEHFLSYRKTKYKGISYQKEMSLLTRDSCETQLYQQSEINVCVVGQIFNRSGGIFINFESPLVIWPLTSKSSQSLNAASLAHEIGHHLGLSHNYLGARYLMQGLGISTVKPEQQHLLLTQKEIDTARNQAEFYHIRKEYLL